MGHKIPVNKCCERNGEDGGDEISDSPVGDPLHGRPGSLRLLYQGDDLGQDCVFAYTGGRELERAVLVEGAAHYPDARPLEGRNALARDHGLVYVAFSLQNHAVRRNLFAGLDQEHVAL